jgi:sulfate transport system permease protein
MTTDVNRRVLPGFSLSLGWTLIYLGLLVLVPLAAGFLKASQLSFADFWAAVSSDRAVAAYRLTVGVAFASAAVNVALGVLVAWVLVRYEFPLKAFLDSLVDLPFALPTAVAGLVYSALLVPTGWYGRFLVPLGIEGAYSRLGIVGVLVFVGFPFVVRTLQPVLEDLDVDVEEAAACLGAARLQTALRVIFPTILPSVVTGFALAFARGLGEYGSVVFISGNMPFKTEIAPVLIVARLEEFAYTEATAIAVVLLLISFTTLFAINLLERWSKRHHG